MNATPTPHRQTVAAYRPTARASSSDRFGPTLVELLFVLTACVLFSFRFTGLLSAIVVGFVFWRSDHSLPHYFAMALTAVVFLAPYDLRLAGSAQHYGTSTHVVSVVPVFGSHQIAHSSIRKNWPEYYTSHIVNYPRWVLSVDLGKL
jgi:hypothetical protein